MNDTDPVQQSLLSWAISSLGPIYIILLPLSALLGFLCVLILLFRGRGPMAAASILLFVHAPLVIGIFAAVQGMINVYSVIGMSWTTPKPADLAVGYSTALFAPAVSMLLIVPSYLAAAVGTFVRAVLSRDDANSTSDSIRTKTEG
ncbi:hypothetical protein CA13_09590 [Planctomycetes bacterium CA13]|uniref:MotA/TolQ/ExbB proton channel domain-containing protein n=1 Tax=Novipirellula herctigrandis TaxID=2527986 RepID=A0A5C5YV06_9BACT|nr:hypothetical protein CA13_00470 [Planctomycetes bacterium CA13]TWT79555.1 hypothetical protein CA13_09590 [Planctomycetes bacterium CA13]